MLPTIQHPVFTLDLPISKTKIRYRPMLVREEKMLLIAKESRDQQTIIENVKAIINNCVQESIDFDTLPLVEVEYIFLHLRAKSVGDSIELRIVDEHNNSIKHDVNFSVDEIEIIIDPQNNRHIKLDDSIGIMMKYPTLNSQKNIQINTTSDFDFYSTVMNGIDSVYDMESVYKFSESSDTEKLAFIDSLSVAHLEKIRDFFATLPKLSKEIKYINSKGDEAVLVLESFYDFF